MAERNGFDDFPHSGYGRADRGSASIVQVETIGRGGVFALWFSAFIAAGSLISVIALCFWIDRLSARVYVLEYDLKNVCAGLLAKEVLEACH